MAITKLKYAKLPFGFVYAPGLFCTLKKGDRKRLKLDITYSAEQSTIRFWGPEPLDSTDLRVLQGLVAHATASLRHAKQLLRDGRAMRSALELVGDAVGKRTIAVRLNLTSFIESIGYAKGGTARNLVTDSITRLAAVTVIVTQPGFEGSFRVVSGYSRATATGDMVVGLNPMLTTAVFNHKVFVSVSIEEARQLRSGVAHLLHWRLHWINQGTVRRVKLDTLCGYVYPKSSALVPSSTARRRQFTVREGLRELRSIGWIAIEADGGIYKISRPRHTQSNLALKRGVTRTSMGA